ncbi:MAG: T9SS type A sorting domain-containing protein [Bacteroidales bacterium]|nr:T9SS type A sorting domain-containing protein [Bacteroidales bacterium]
MNKMKKLLLFITLLVASTAIMAQPNVSWRFNNFQLINGDTQLQFDVEVMADAPGYYFGLNTVAFDYGNAAFGASVVPASVTVDRGVLLQETYAPTLYKYNVQGVANTFAQTISASIQQVIGGPAFAAFHTEIPTTWMSFFTYTFDIAPGAAPGTMTEIVFYDVAHPGSIPLMNGQCMYIDPTGANVPYANSTVTPPGMPQLDPFDIFNFEVVPGGPTTNQWTGAIDDDWFNTGNWSLGTVPDNTTDVEIPNTGGKAPLPTISGGVAATAALGILSGASLGVAPDGGLETHGLFTNDGFFGVLSDATGMGGTYIDLGGIAGTGAFEYWRDITSTASTGDDAGWHFISAPIAGFSTDDILDYYLNTYDEGTGLYVHVEGVAPCIPVTPAMPWTALEGWSVKFQPEYAGQCGAGGTGTVLEFSGLAADVHSGAIPGSFTAGGPVAEHWNLMGNPYMSALDADAMVATWPAALNTSIYQYNDAALDFVEWSAAVPGVNNLIAPTQGFFVSATAGGTLTVDNSMRAHGGMFMKSEVDNLLGLQASGNGYEDEMYIRFMEEATANFDGSWDAYKLLTQEEAVPQIYTTTTGANLAIDARPATEMVPMEFVAGLNGTYTIAAIETSNFSEVTLEDVENGVFTNLLTDSYTFDYNNAEAHNFIIHFGALGTGELNASNVNIWSNDSKVYVQVPQDLRGDIVIYNMMGQEVVATDIQPNVINVIPIDEVNTYYVVKVISNEEIVTGKVYIK